MAKTALVLLALAVGLASPAAASANARHSCGNYVGTGAWTYGRSELPGILGVKSRGVGCKVARRFARRVTGDRVGAHKGEVFRYRHYRCTVPAAATSRAGWSYTTFECRRSARRIHWRVRWP